MIYIYSYRVPDRRSLLLHFPLLIQELRDTTRALANKLRSIPRSSRWGQLILLIRDLHLHQSLRWEKIGGIFFTSRRIPGLTGEVSLLDISQP